MKAFFQRAWCLVMHRKGHRHYWSEYRWYYLECKACGRTWREPRTEHFYQPRRFRQGKETVGND